MAASKDVMKYLRTLEQRGYRVTRTDGGAHFKVYSGSVLVMTAGGGTNQRTLRNMRGEVRRFERAQQASACAL